MNRSAPLKRTPFKRRRPSGVPPKVRAQVRARSMDLCELVARLKRLWRAHDRLEREILLVERHFTDAQLRRLGAAGGPR